MTRPTWLLDSGIVGRCACRESCCRESFFTSIFFLRLSPSLTLSLSVFFLKHCHCHCPIIPMNVSPGGGCAWAGKVWPGWSLLLFNRMVPHTKRATSEVITCQVLPKAKAVVDSMEVLDDEVPMLWNLLGWCSILPLAISFLHSQFFLVIDSLIQLFMVACGSCDVMCDCPKVVDSVASCVGMFACQGDRQPWQFDPATGTWLVLRTCCGLFFNICCKGVWYDLFLGVYRPQIIGATW